METPTQQRTCHKNVSKLFKVGDRVTSNIEDFPSLNYAIYKETYIVTGSHYHDRPDLLVKSASPIIVSVEPEDTVKLLSKYAQKLPDSFNEAFLKKIDE